MLNTTDNDKVQQPNSLNTSENSSTKQISLEKPKSLLQDINLLKQLNKFPLTDAGNAECFALLHQESLRFCKSRKKWLKWHGNIWKVETDGEAHRAAIFTARARKAAATYINNQDLKMKSEKWAMDSESGTKRNAMLTTATHLESIEVRIEQFDQNPFLAGVRNGTLDLKNGEFRESKREDYISMQFDVAFDPHAKAPRWMQFLYEIFQGDKELISFIQRATGYLLTGDTSEQVLFLCYGKGANGKSVFLEIFSHLLGDYAGNCAFSTFEANKRNEATNDLAALKGKRFVSAIETDEDKRLAEARVKSVTGQDLITARFLYSEFFSYRPSFKIWMAVNHKPLIRGTDDGIWRRIRLIPYMQTFLTKADPHLVEKLKRELPGILNWALEGLKSWHQQGLGTATIIKNASQEYRKESDLLQQWIEECTTSDININAACSDAYQSFVEWCVSRGYPKWSMNSFSRAMTEKGFERKSDGRKRNFVGLSLVP